MLSPSGEEWRGGGEAKGSAWEMSVPSIQLWELGFSGSKGPPLADSRDLIDCSQLALCTRFKWHSSQQRNGYKRLLLPLVRRAGNIKTKTSRQNAIAMLTVWPVSFTILAIALISPLHFPEFKASTAVPMNYAARLCVYTCNLDCTAL